MTGPQMKTPATLAGVSGAVVIQQASRTTFANTTRTGLPTRLLTRGEAIAAKCRECLYDDQSAGTWRQQVSACPSTECSLWPVRPLAGGVPSWITAREVSRLPDDWRTLTHDVAVAMVAGRVDASPHGCAGEAIRDASAQSKVPAYPEAA